MRYFGPETLLPVASGVAGAIGAILLFGRRVVALVRRLAARVFRRPPATPAAKE